MVQMESFMRNVSEEMDEVILNVCTVSCCFWFGGSWRRNGSRSFSICLALGNEDILEELTDDGNEVEVRNVCLRH
jgi:hypothetical protein